ncbi:MAG TPA: c-type cytochrome domain-containing protein [Bryobacteraceae bacterium]|nr:c-type cytochrome domain-containing protein [Bryobacteraceae bacterium]
MKALAICLFLASLGRAQEPVSFVRQIKPILARQCLGCHQGASRQGDLSLAAVKDIKTGGKKGSALAGAPEKSLLVSYLTGEVKPQMPFGGKPLPDDQIELFRRWIREGAKDDSPADAPAAPVSTGPTVYHAPPVITAVAISPDGKWMAISGYREILLREYGGELIARLPGLSDRIHSIIFSPDGKTLAAVGGSPARFGEVQIWDLASRKQTHSVMVSNDTLFGASFSPDGSRIACGAADKSIRIFETASGKEIRKMDHHEDWVFGAVFGVDGKRLVSVSRDKAAKLTDANTGAFIENVNLINPTKEPLTALVRHPKKDWVLIGGEERVPYLYMMDRPRAMRIADDSTLIRKFDRQDGPILALAYSPDAKYVAVGSAAGDVHIYEAETGELSGSCSGHRGGIYTLQFHPDSRHLVSAGFDGVVRIYDLTGKLEKDFVPVPLEKAVVSQK